MRESGRNSALKVAILILLTTLFVQAQAQEAAPNTMKIGFILPAERETGDELAALYNAVAESARQGAIMAEEEFGFNAQLLGGGLDVIFEEASDEASARQAAERLLDKEVFVLVGGFGLEVANTLSQVAEERQVPLLNIGEASDALRNELCSPYTFHIEPSAAMYLDALAGWFIRSQFRRWFIVHASDVEGEARYERMIWVLRNRHFGAREAGKAAVEPGTTEFEDLFRNIQRARPDVVLLLLEPKAQLAFLSQYEAAGLEIPVTGFPDTVTQTRAFFEASRSAAPNAGSGYRATAWEATLDAYGARELNNRFAERWNGPMDAPAWAAYQAVKISFEMASFGKTQQGDELASYLERPETVFDIWKGIGVTFRPWDHQLRQPLYLISINETAQDSRSLAILVGELPAIYMPRTDPVERLDQLGDLSRESSCAF